MQHKTIDIYICTNTEKIQPKNNFNSKNITQLMKSLAN